METVNFEKTTVLCTFCLPHKNKKRPRRDAFCFATRILLQVFFVQEFCHKYFSYKCFATSVFAGKSFATSVVIQLFTHKSFAKHQASTKLFFATSVFSHTASFICCKAHVSSFNAMQQYQPKSRQRVSLCKGCVGIGRKCETPLQCKCYDVAQLCFSLWLHYKFVRLLRRFVIDKTVCFL